MSYVVLARKYRPRIFSEMVGQEHVVQALTNALETQRLHHAYLFTGTRGVGKTTVSRILAKSLNCVGPDGQGGITAEPCGVCQACTDIDSGRFVDYTELDAASNRGVEEVQSLLEQAVYKPVQGRFKVFMIDEVHMLTNHAFNAMLKTLEEPPEYLKFVLATTDPQKVPVTVLSRCLQFNLRPMAPETVSEHLQSVLQAESVNADPTSLRLIARAARGSMRDALSLTDQAIAFGGGQLQDATVRQMLGAVDRTYVFRLIEALAASDGAGVVGTVDTLRDNGLNAASTLEELVTVLQRMAVSQAVPASQRTEDSSDPDQAEIDRLADLLPSDETQLLYSMCLHGRGELGLAPDEYAALTMVLLRLLAFKPAGNVATTEKKTLKPATEPVRTAPVAPERAPAALPASARPPENLPSNAPALAQRKAPVPADPPPAVSASSSAPPWEDMGSDVISEAEMEDDAALMGRQNHGSGQVVAVPVRRHPPEHPPGAAADADQRVRSLPVRDEADRQQRAEKRSGPSDSGVTRAQKLRPTDEGAFWFALVSELAAAEAITALVRQLALQSQLVARDTDQWHLRIENGSLNNTNARERLCAALAGAGHAVRLTIEIGPVHDSPSLRQEAQAAARLEEAERVFRDDPFVQRMMRDFGGKIVPGSLKAAADGPDGRVA
ncbi:DNA polymerase III subunit gamma/tau [Hydrogenophaga sp. 5NK40-0174]|uniref:DNA polymerase III subunit gamma/tau n=1 Tax=Hydrogenophaga sp. 5NK40-0174 TaxID=3127649 RepID=UPI003104C805